MRKNTLYPTTNKGLARFQNKYNYKLIWKRPITPYSHLVSPSFAFSFFVDTKFFTVWRFMGPLCWENLSTPFFQQHIFTDASVSLLGNSHNISNLFFMVTCDQGSFLLLLELSGVPWTANYKTENCLSCVLTLHWPAGRISLQLVQDITSEAKKADVTRDLRRSAWVGPLTETKMILLEQKYPQFFSNVLRLFLIHQWF